MTDDFQFAETLLRTRVRDAIHDQLSAQHYTTSWKADNTPVTSVDLNVQRLINDEIHASYPDDAINGEEASVEGESGFTWVVDPIDGTQALGMLDTFTVCIARVDKSGQPIFGMVYNPTTDELFSARQGKPATVNSEPIKVSAQQVLKSSYIFLTSRLPDSVASNGTIYDRLEAQGAKVFNVRSLAFSCVMVACGKAAGAILGVSTPYEAAPVTPIIGGAGGTVTDLSGKSSQRLDGDINGLVVSNGLVHEALLKLLEL